MSSALSHRTTFLPASESLITLAVSSFGTLRSTSIGWGGFKATNGTTKVVTVAVLVVHGPPKRLFFIAWDISATSLRPDLELRASNLNVVGEYDDFVAAGSIKMQRGRREPQFPLGVFPEAPNSPLAGDRYRTTLRAGS